MAFTPDPPLSMKSIADREMEAIELDARMESVGERLHELCTHEGFGAVSDDVDNDGDNRQKRKNSAAHPPWPAGSTSNHVFGGVSHASNWMPFDRLLPTVF